MGAKFETLIQKANKDFKTEIIQKGLGRCKIERIPFGDARLDFMTYGGIPEGRLIEYFGAEGGGKTTLALLNVVQAQRKYPEKQVLYLDLENTIDEDRARLMGVNTDELYILRPENQSAEEIMEIALRAVETNEISLVVLDSVPALTTQATLKKDMTEKTFCGVAGPMTTFCQKVVPLLKKTQTTFIMVNQVRDVINSMFPQKSTPGGRALKHACSLRIQLKRGKLIDENCREVVNTTENPSGIKIKVDIAKTKVFKPNRLQGTYTISNDFGVDLINDLVDTCEWFGIVVRSGSWFSLVDPDTGEILSTEDGTVLKFQGKAGLVNFLREDKDIKDELHNKCYEMSLPLENKADACEPIQ